MNQFYILQEDGDGDDSEFVVPDGGFSLDDLNPKQPVANGTPSDPPSEGEADPSKCYTCIVKITMSDGEVSTVTFSPSTGNTSPSDPGVDGDKPDASAPIRSYFSSGTYEYTGSKPNSWNVASVEKVEIIKGFFADKAECPPPANPPIVPNPEKPTPPSDPPPKFAPIVFEIDGCSGWPQADNSKKLPINLSAPNEIISTYIKKEMQRYIIQANKLDPDTGLPRTSVFTLNYDPKTKNKSRTQSNPVSVFVVDPETNIDFATNSNIQNQSPIIWEKGTYGILGDKDTKLPITKKIVWRLKTGVSIKFEFEAKCDLICDTNSTVTGKTINLIIDEKGTLNFILSQNIVFSRRIVDKKTGLTRFFAKIEDCTFKDTTTGSHPDPATNCPQCAGLGKKDSSLAQPLNNWMNPDKFEFIIGENNPGCIQYTNNKFIFNFSDVFKTNFVKAFINLANTTSDGRQRDCPCCISKIIEISLKNGEPSIEYVSGRE